MSHCSKLIENLINFNSKERFYLVGKILGNPEFAPAPDFIKELSKKLFGVPDKLPEKSSFSAMDYHFDWLYASLELSVRNNLNCFPNKEGIIQGQQEDLDFILVFEIDDGCHIVLIEAKGVTGWTNSQMKSKAKRLKVIFGEDGKNYAGVTPHFVILSRDHPQKLDKSVLPDWMKPDGEIIWMKLEIPTDLNRVARCDKNGDEKIEGTFWKVSKRFSSQ